MDHDQRQAMSAESARCFGCGGWLEPGFLEDSGESSKGFVRWIPGPLEKGIFGGARRLGKRRADVHAYRCTACGLLALYVEGNPLLTSQARAKVGRDTSAQPMAPAPSPFYPEA